MATPSPSEFLTFFRRASRTASLRPPIVSQPLAVRPFSSTVQNAASGKVKTDAMPDDQHTTNKTDRLDVQNDNSAKGKEGRAQDVGGQATREKDERNSAAKAKEEFPESPVQIGMQDERGGKGHS